MVTNIVCFFLILGTSGVGLENVMKRCLRQIQMDLLVNLVSVRVIPFFVLKTWFVLSLCGLTFGAGKWNPPWDACWFSPTYSELSTWSDHPGWMAILGPAPLINQLLVHLLSPCNFCTLHSPFCTACSIRPCCATAALSHLYKLQRGVMGGQICSASERAAR